MSMTLNIDPNGIYDDSILVLALDLSHSTLARERRGGQLRYVRKGQRVLYLGQWILNWLEGEDETAAVAAPETMEALAISK